MKKIYSLVIAVIAVVATTVWPSLHAQETTPFSRVNLALRFSTVGVGLELATPLGSHLNLRAGAGTLPLSLGYSNYSLSSYSGDLEPSFGYMPDYRAKVKVEMVHGHVLADIYPASHGIFHLTVGAYAGRSQIGIQGSVVNSSNNEPAVLLPGYSWPVVNIDGYEVETENGRANLDLVLGNAVKPYLGIGLGRAVTQRGFGVKFELGMLYQGDYTLKQDGRILNINDSDEVEGKDISFINKYSKWSKWWPMINLQFSFRVR
ncbi:MAG: hypothetical protein LBJ60_08005 [Tannerellaceae bacterium]|jgi:hypothetical protein|nr:hypothetical protein [Tannerellaceae bacterium]